MRETTYLAGRSERGIEGGLAFSVTLGGTDREASFRKVNRKRAARPAWASRCRIEGLLM